MRSIAWNINIDELHDTNLSNGMFICFGTNIGITTALRLHNWITNDDTIHGYTEWYIGCHGSCANIDSIAYRIGDMDCVIQCLFGVLHLH